MNFIPAQESDFFISIFRIYTKWLFKRRFKKVWIHQEYHPSKNDKTVFFLNHSSWWDGLIPFVLNEYRFKQKGRAMMEYKQMRTYPFFKRLGAFSIIPHNRSHNLISLRYAVRSMQRPNASLFLYPQGEILAAGSELSFKRGISWLQKQLTDIDFVPVGIYIHTIRHDKPELHIWVAKKMPSPPTGDITSTTAVFEKKMHNVLTNLKDTAGFSDDEYEPFF